jgi:hypothetical protein
MKSAEIVLKTGRRLGRMMVRVNLGKVLCMLWEYTSETPAQLIHALKLFKKKDLKPLGVKRTI